jgi:hypothetical protein
MASAPPVPSITLAAPRLTRGASQGGVPRACGTEPGARLVALRNVDCAAQMQGTLPPASTDPGMVTGRDELFMPDGARDAYL